MKIILNAEALTFYPLAKPGFSGGTERYVKVVARGLAEKGHQVHVIAADAETDERRGENEWWWPPSYHPWDADAVVAVHSLEHVTPDSGYKAPLLIAATNGLGAFLGPEDEWAKFVDAWPVFSKCHADLLVKQHKNIDPAKCHVTGLGVDLSEYPDVTRYWVDASPEDFERFGASKLPNLQMAHYTKVPGRMFFSNDPLRGLWHVLDILEIVKKEVPHATLHVGYDFDRQYELRRWAHSAVAEMMGECKRRLQMPGVVNLGALSHEHTVSEQLACHVHVMPSDPPNLGSQIHGMLQLELAAAGTPLVLSDTEAFPEVFPCAEILPLPGKLLPQIERRVTPEDWAEAVIELMTEPEKWAEASRKSRALAETMTWDRVVDAWDSMLVDLAAKAVSG